MSLQSRNIYFSRQTLKEQQQYLGQTLIESRNSTPQTVKAEWKTPERNSTPNYRSTYIYWVQSREKVHHNGPWIKVTSLSETNRKIPRNNQIAKSEGDTRSLGCPSGMLKQLSHAYKALREKEKERGFIWNQETKPKN